MTNITSKVKAKSLFENYECDCVERVLCEKTIGRRYVIMIEKEQPENEQVNKEP